VPPKVKRSIALTVGALGLSVLAAGSFLAFIRMRDLSPADANVALANLADVKLDRVAATDSLVISLVIPDTEQWARIRQRWGAPDFFIAAVSPVKSICYCLTKLPITITLADNADQIPSQPAGPPYSYSSDCPLSTLKFNAAPGTKLTVSVARNQANPLPPGDLIIVASWRNTKDKLVGISLDEELRTVSTIAILSGSALVLLAALLTWRRRA
jgi:hypothetical protein